MIQLNSTLKVIDNSGARLARCIKVLNNTKYAYTGDIIIVAIRKVLPNKKIKLGEVHKGLIVSTTKNQKRINGTYFKFHRNAVVLLTNKGLPQGSRIIGSLSRDLRKKGFKKIVSLAKKSV